MARSVTALLLVLAAGNAYANEEMSVQLPGGAELELVWVEAGRFSMGTSADQESELRRTGSWLDQSVNERPDHEVTVQEGFWLGKYELTQAQWESVMGTRPWKDQPYAVDEGQRPAVYVSWYDAQEFLQRLNEAAGAALYRLPTEAEWEYACRAGTSSIWFFDDQVSQLGEYAWYWDNTCGAGDCAAQPVGLKRPNPWGLHDMLGNVWEWCQDWYSESYYSTSAQVDPQGPTSGSERISRGGVFDDDDLYVRTALRGHASPVFPLYSLGLRLVREQPGGTTVVPRSWGEVKLLAR